MFKVPQKIYFERNSIQYLQSCRNVNKVFIVTDRSMVEFGFVNKITDQLNQRRTPVSVQLFCDVEPDPDIETVRRGVQLMNAFKPDTIIALGGGSSMDAAKGMWLFYEHPEVNFDDLKQKFMDIRKRAFKYPELGRVSKLICMQTTSGTGLKDFSWHPSYETIHGTVASLRLDSLLSLAFNSSRSSLTSLVENGSVYVNGRLTTSNGYKLKENDIISVRGYGKFKYCQTLSETRKGRLSVELQRYK